MSFEPLFEPFERLDGWLTGGLEGAPLIVVLLIAVALGLRHAADPDHLVAITSLVAADDRRPRRAAALGAWWGAGHAVTLLLAGLPLIALSGRLPVWLQDAAERAVGVVIVALALRLLWKWVRGGYRVSRHHHQHGSAHRHVHPGGVAHEHDERRTPRQAFAIGTLHGLAGTGGVVLLLAAGSPSAVQTALTLAAFAPMSMVSMAAATAGFGWILTRPPVHLLFARAGVPTLGAFGLLFGIWYTGGA